LFSIIICRQQRSISRAGPLAQNANKIAISGRESGRTAFDLEPLPDHAAIILIHQPGCSNDLAAQNGRDDTAHDVAKAENKRTDHDSHGNVAFVYEIIEIESRGEFIERHIAEDDEKHRDNAEGDRRDEIAEEVFREVEFHIFGLLVWSGY